MKLNLLILNLFFLINFGKNIIKFNKRILNKIKNNKIWRKLTKKLIRCKNFSIKIKLYNKIKRLLFNHKVNKYIKAKIKRNLRSLNSLIKFIKNNENNFKKMSYSEFIKFKNDIILKFNNFKLKILLNNYQYKNIKYHEEIEYMQRIKLKLWYKLKKKYDNFNFLIKSNQPKFNRIMNRIKKNMKSKKLKLKKNGDYKFIDYTPRFISNYLNEVNIERKKKKIEIFKLENQYDDKYN